MGCPFVPGMKIEKMLRKWDKEVNYSNDDIMVFKNELWETFIDFEKEM